jgi:5-methylcytosine-specific restriction endonuclease McrA
MNTRKTQSNKYYGVYRNSNGTFLTKFLCRGKYYTYGPFPTEEEAARQYDIEVLKKYPNRTELNFPSNDEIEINLETRVKTIKKKLDKTHGSNISKKQTEKNKYFRQQFPAIMRNKICANQKWKCNFCLKTLSDKIIIDHMIPLFLNGSNGTFNLQALCPSCDRFKTSYLDIKVLKPFNQKQQLTVKDVLRIQKEHYFMMNCIDPSKKDHDTDSSDDDSIDSIDDEEYKCRPNKIRRKMSNLNDNSETDSESLKDEPEENDGSNIEVNLSGSLSSSLNGSLNSFNNIIKPPIMMIKKPTAQSAIVKTNDNKIIKILDDIDNDLNPVPVPNQVPNQVLNQVPESVPVSVPVSAPVSMSFTIGKTLVQITHLT